MEQAVLANVIGAIGERDFAAVAADALCSMLDFELSAVIVHRPALQPAVLYDNFDRVGAREGVRNYVRFTHRMNPMLRRRGARVCRASDFALPSAELEDRAELHLMRADDEELGFRTIGWPKGLEEVGLYFEGLGGMVELGLYRAKARRPVSERMLTLLGSCSVAISAAFDRHHAFAPQMPDHGAAALSARERQVCALLLSGCSSEAISLRLGISRHTVKDHRKAIFRKLGIGSLAELFAFDRNALTPLCGGMV